MQGEGKRDQKRYGSPRACSQNMLCNALYMAGSVGASFTFSSSMPWIDILIPTKSSLGLTKVSQLLDGLPPSDYYNPNLADA
jgi:hypothetical protein